MTNLTSKTVEITKTNPCRCGCKGTDPSHRKTIRRVVQNVVDVDFDAPKNSPEFIVVRRGEIKMPYGMENVWQIARVYEDGTFVAGFWHRA